MYNEATVKQQLIQQGYQNKNHFSGRMYLSEANQRKLNAAWFTTNERLTFWQSRQAGWKIKAWSKGVVVEFKDKVEVEEREGNQIIKKLVPYRKTHLLFNIEQVDPVKAN